MATIPEEDDDSFCIMVATDSHLGYEEKHPVRGNDSFIAFEEMLQLALEHSVDFILLGGDLFHENKPSRYSQVRCMDMLRKYTFGDRPVCFDIVSDPAVNFPHTKQVNYQDPNLNVAVPVFSIHGNHDDPAGLGFMCALEMLSSAGLVNYFGRVPDLTEVKMSPILMQKGKTNLALYGLSSIKDERLHRLFLENKVRMLRPKEAMTDWFNLLVLHQNRAKRGPSNYIPESFLDPFLDLIIWGHEHDCIREPMQSGQNFHVLQPGSSVATSLCSGEALPKHVFLLHINNKHQFKVDGLPLKTVRPFIFQELILSDYNVAAEAKKLWEAQGRRSPTGHEMMEELKSSAFALKGKGGIGRGRKMMERFSKVKLQANPVEDFIEDQVKKLLKDARKLLTGHPRQPTLPLIRIRVIYSNENEMFNICRFGFKFDGLVANTDDLVIFSRERKDKIRDTTGSFELPENLINVDDVTSTVEDLVEEIFRNGNMCEMSVLTERGMSRAIANMVTKDDWHAVSNLVDYQRRRTREHLMSLKKEYDNKEELEADIKSFRASRLTDANKESEELEIEEALKGPIPNMMDTMFDRTQADGWDIIEGVDDDTDFTPSSSSAPRGRGARGRGSRGGAKGTTTTRARGRPRK